MVAGSRAGDAPGYGEGNELPLPFRAARARLLALPALLRRAKAWQRLAALYLLAAAALLLPWPFGAHPEGAYNWESYTAWRWSTYWEPPTGPTIEIWALTDGLMTDSGQGPLVGLPVAAGIAAAGFNIEAMRVPVALLAATAVPLLWLLGRRVAGVGPATLAALLFAISPAFLFYGRTATLVGVSLVPLLLSALALARVLDAGAGAGWRWRREGLLAASLLLGIYAYGPVRLLWPLAIGLLIFAAIRDASRRWVLLRAALLCLIAVPAATMALDRLTAPEPDPVGTALSYFHARGEQLVAMSGDLDEVGYYLRDGDASVATGWDVARLLIEQNAADLGGLLLDRDTAPILTDYWNERGRFWPWFFLPFALIGALAAAWKGLLAGQTVRLLSLALGLGLMLPLLLTSRVHVGRLLPALPFALLLVAAGVWAAAAWIAAITRRGEDDAGLRWLAPVLAAAFVLPAAVAAHAEMAVPLGPSRETLAAAVMADWLDDARERGGAVLVEDPGLGDEIERVRAAGYRLDLDPVYRFVDLGDDAALGHDDSRPDLLWRGALGALRAGEIARPCQRLWFVTAEASDEFFAAWNTAGCKGAPDSVVLP